MSSVTLPCKLHVGCMFNAPFKNEPRGQLVHTRLLIARQLAHIVHAYEL